MHIHTHSHTHTYTHTLTMLKLDFRTKKKSLTLGFHIINHAFYFQDVSVSKMIGSSDSINAL